MRGKSEGLYLWTRHSSDCKYAEVVGDRADVGARRLGCGQGCVLVGIRAQTCNLYGRHGTFRNRTGSIIMPLWASARRLRLIMLSLILYRPK
jgi:hypothetical protein